MTDELLAYLLDDLPPERRAEIDAKLVADAAWRWELERLRECLASGGDAQQCAEEPPQDLVRKTCDFVEDSASGKFKIEKKCGRRQPVLSEATACNGRRSWSAADVMIGGGVALILAALAMPAIRQSRDAARRDTCAYNLKALGTATADYAERNRFQLPPVLPGQPAAMFIVGLVEAGELTPEETLAIVTCPDSQLASKLFEPGKARRIPSRQELALADGATLNGLLQQMGLTYAIALGHRDADQQYRQPTFTGGMTVPLMADAPAITPTGFRPASHGGCTQNVLNESLSVTPYSVCVLAEEDERLRQIHLNDNGILAAGCSPDDAVLAPASHGPDGPIGWGLPRSIPVNKILVIQVGK